MRVLIDTHICIWALYDPDKLNTEVKNILTNPANKIYISVATVWETIIKHSRYKDAFQTYGSDLLADAVASNIGVIPIVAADVLTLETLTYPAEGVKRHKDPFDRIMLAQAKNNNMLFITNDGLIPNYEEPCVVYMPEI